MLVFFISFRLFWIMLQIFLTRFSVQNKLFSSPFFENHHCDSCSFSCPEQCSSPAQRGFTYLNVFFFFFNFIPTLQQFPFEIMIFKQQEKEEEKEGQGVNEYWFFSVFSMKEKWWRLNFWNNHQNEFSQFFHELKVIS